MDVSIIIPIYNAERFIIKCLESIVSQTYSDEIECILIDDCSSDNCNSLENQFIANYKGPVRFLLLQQTHNQGPSAARNRGIREAKGDYVFFLDADDSLSPDCIEKLFYLAKKYDADYVQGTYSNENNKDLNRPDFLDDKKKIKRLLLDYTKIPFTPHNRLVKRSMLLEHQLFFNENIKVREDFLWMTFVAKYVERFASCPDVTYIWGYNEESLTHHKYTDREAQGYKVLIETMCANIDPFERGAQKALALDALIMAINGGYFAGEKEKKYLIGVVASTNRPCEKLLLNVYLRTKEDHLKTKILHLLNRLYKI